MNKVAKQGTAFHYRDFRLLWTATMFSSASAWALIVARGWLMYEITDGSSAWVAIVTFSAMIPRVLITPIFGYLSDKLDRKRFLAFMFAINIIHNIFLGILVTTDVSDGVKMLADADIPLYVFKANYSKRIFVKRVEELQEIWNTELLGDKKNLYSEIFLAKLAYLLCRWHHHRF